MNPDWLGHYTDGGDSWEGGRRTIRFTPTADGDIRFDWNCRHESNHGYSEASEMGRVISADDSSITVELAQSDASSWEDWFKEHDTHTDTTIRRVTIEITAIIDGKPRLSYAGAAFGLIRNPA